MFCFFFFQLLLVLKQTNCFSAWYLEKKNLVFEIRTLFDEQRLKRLLRTGHGFGIGLGLGYVELVDLLQVEFKKSEGCKPFEFFCFQLLLVLKQTNCFLAWYLEKKNFVFEIRTLFDEQTLERLLRTGHGFGFGLGLGCVEPGGIQKELRM